jgi:acyl-CoA synthetase (AMP-forming)/AMP-acid ligase II
VNSLSLPLVQKTPARSIPDLKWGEVVMACVMLKPESTLTADDLIAFCRKSLASYKIPRRVEFSEAELPKSGSGKILKRVLRERFWVHQERAVS